MKLVTILIAIPIVVIVAVAIWRLNARRLRRVQALAPEQFVVLFQSNMWFQNAVLRLRSEGVIDPETKTDSEDPTGGPRWASASSESFSFWRGYSTTPFFRLPWSKITEVSRTMNTLPSTNRTSSWGIGVTVDGGDKPIHLFLEQPTALGSASGRSRDIDAIVAELDRRRGATARQDL